MNEMISAATSLFEGGRWATQQLKAAALAGRGLSAKALRTLDTLRHEEWKYFDKALVEEGAIRLVGVGDLINAGLTLNVPNALGKMVVGYEKITDMDVATTSLDGLGQTNNDVQEFDLSQTPLPITHKDFFINLRKLVASRESGEALDTTNIRVAGRRVVEQLEKLLFQGGPTFGTLKIYGYTTHPDRNTLQFDGGKDWGDATKAGTSFLTDVLAMKQKLIDDRYYGPFSIYVSSDADTQLDRDYDTSANRISIRSRLLQVSGVTAIKPADQLPSSNVVMKQDTSDVAVWVNGETLQTIQWDEAGGMKVHFKAMAIGVPLIRSTSAGRSGIVHLSD